ncbi:MAG: prepilin-type N-terminal cleavage/methylation domain-containing protein [Prochloraceae cyanobacterium]|nr:prepilin-type N-terminal cleavage/methylation domain-containing protein [Prochloraceae cyanobacterium]
MKTIKKSNAGFTLIELLAAVVLTGVVVSAAGLGVIQMIKADRNSSDLTEGRVDLNRVTDYIAEDIRSSSNIDYTVNIASYSLPAELPTGGQAIMALDNGGGQIIYYESPEPDDSVWNGPKTLWRWDVDANKASLLIDELDSVAAIACDDSTPNVCAEVILTREEQEVTASAVTRIR